MSHKHQCEVCGEGFNTEPYYVLGRKVCSKRCQATVANDYWNKQRARMEQADEYADEIEATKAEANAAH